MEINLKIKNKDGACCRDCAFLDANNWPPTGTCLLFKETLRPKTKWGDVEYWHQCLPCWKITQKEHEEN